MNIMFVLRVLISLYPFQSINYVGDSFVSLFLGFCEQPYECQLDSNWFQGITVNANDNFIISETDDSLYPDPFLMESLVLQKEENVFSPSDMERLQNDNCFYAPKLQADKDISTSYNNDSFGASVPKSVSYDNDLEKGIFQLNNEEFGIKKLKKDLDLEEQLLSPNVIYEVQDNFDLAGKEITIPTNSVLKFNGGSFCNGTINADYLSIISSGKIFDNIRFSGRCRFNSTIKLEWFIQKYPISTDDLTIDNTSEIESCFNCGAYNILFPTDRFLHITRTISVAKKINILVDELTSRLSESPSSGNEYENYTYPCLFSKEVVTLLDYQIGPYDSSYDQLSYNHPFSIGGINLFVDKAYGTLSENSKTMPVINIETAGEDIWGVVIDANIRIRSHTIPIPREYQSGSHKGDKINNYTGIKITSRNGYISFLKINGDIYGAYYGIIARKGEGKNNWITDITINGNTNCCFGGLFVNAGPVFIYGSHQTRYYDGNSQDTGYFEGAKIELYGMVWDCYSQSPRSLWRTVFKPIKLTSSFLGDSFISNSVKSVSNSFPAVVPTVAVTKDDLYYDASMAFSGNVLNKYLNGNQPTIVKSLSYVIDGVDILSGRNDIVYNSDNLFNENNHGRTSAGVVSYSNNAYVLGTVKTIIVSFIIDNKGLTDSPMLLYRMYRNAAKSSVPTEVKLYSCSSLGGEYNLDDRFHIEASYYNYVNNIIRLKILKRYTKVEIKIETAEMSGSFSLPTICLLSEHDYYSNHPAGYSDRRPLFNNNQRQGFCYFDKTLNKPIWWNGSAWIDKDGFTATNRRGTTDERPVGIGGGGVLDAIRDIGFVYYDITIGKPIFAKEIDVFSGNVIWVDANGDVL